MITLLAAITLSGVYLHDIDVYDITLRVRVPRIYDNTESQGYRKWQNQCIKGEMWVDYDSFDENGRPDVYFYDMCNRTHKINGKNITYRCTRDEDCMLTRWAVHGSNKTSKFTQASCCYYMDMEPSYNIGEDEPDNSLLMWFSGYGTVSKRTLAGETRNMCYMWSGECVGTMGCGCRAYGHVSPTRLLGYCGPEYDRVTDVATVIGRWRAKINASKTVNARIYGRKE